MSNEPSHSEHGTAPDHSRDAMARPGDVPAPAPGVEDAGAQALSEALQSSFKIVKFLMVALVIAFFASGFFTVKPNEVAIKLRFGRPVGLGSEQLLAPEPPEAPQLDVEVRRVRGGATFSASRAVAVGDRAGDGGGDLVGDAAAQAASAHDARGRWKGVTR